MCNTSDITEYWRIPYQMVSVKVKGHGTYDSCAKHVSQAIEMYSANSVQTLQNVIIWVSEGGHDTVDEIVAVRAITDRFTLLVMIASLSASEPHPDYDIFQREIPDEARVRQYIDRIIRRQADRLS